MNALRHTAAPRIAALTASLATLALLTIGAIAGDAGAIEGDPVGTKVCRTLADWIGGYWGGSDNGIPLDRDTTWRVLAERAAESTTPAIWSAADLRALRDGCVVAGMPMPPYAEPTMQ